MVGPDFQSPPAQLNPSWLNSGESRVAEDPGNNGEWWQNRTPVQRQICGEASSSANYWGINWNGYVDDEIPLRKELKSRGLLDRAIPWLR